MKVAMVDPSLFTGRYDDSLCAALGQAGADVTLFGRPARVTDAIAPRHYHFAERFFRFGEHLRGRIGDGALFKAIKTAEYFAFSQFGDLSALAGADVIHVQWLPLATCDRRWIRRIASRPERPALVHTVHNVAAFHGDGGLRSVGYTQVMRQFDVLIVHSEASRAALIHQGFVAERIRVVPHPPMRLVVAKEDELAQVPDPGTDDATGQPLPRVLFFGTLRPYKGVDLLISACLDLWRDGVKFELAIAGKPFMDVAPLIERVRAAGFGDRLILDLGFLNEDRLDAHLRKADIITFPYREIDSSGAFLAALHYGKAMLCSRVGMFATLPDQNGDSPVGLFTSEDASALAAALAALVTDRTAIAAMGACALALEKKLASWNEAAVLTLAAYDSAREVAVQR